MNYNIDQMASEYGLTEPYVNKLKSTSQYITNGFNKDKDVINTQYNQLLNDYESERKSQDQKFNDEGKAAYIDYAKSINPYSSNNSSNFRGGLNTGGFSESSLIGANNTYQNRYTNTKNNFENIFSDINNRIGKAKENRSIEEAKLAREEQNQLLQNFWRINEDYTAEKSRQEEQRRWEQEMSLSRSKLYAEQNQELNLNGPQVNTQWYQGGINQDAQYGTFGTLDNNGNLYQPNNVGGSALKKSGYKVSDVLGNISNSNGTTTLGNQSIWTTGGKYYVWDGTANRYIDVSSSAKKKIK